MHPLTITRTVYDPATRDFIFDSAESKALPSIRQWINNNNPFIYWYILRVDNQSELSLDQWAIELYTHQALNIKEAYIDGIDRCFELKKRENDSWCDKYVLSIPKQLGIPIVGKGTRRILFKVDINCREGLMHEYGISGRFIAHGVESADIKEKFFQYSCKVGEFKQILDNNPDEASVYAEKRMSARYSAKDVQLFTNSFRMIHDLYSYCHSGLIQRDELLHKLQLLEDNFEKVPDIAKDKITPLLHDGIRELGLRTNNENLKSRYTRLCDSLVELLHIEVMGTNLGKGAIAAQESEILSNGTGYVNGDDNVSRQDGRTAGVGSSERHEKNSHGHDYTVNTGKLHQAQALKKPQVQNLSGPREQKIGKKAFLFPVLIIIVLAGYWMFSPLLVVNSGNQDTIIPQNTKVVDSPLAANDTNNVSIDNKTATTNTQLDLETYTNSIGMEFVLIPAGEFQMGSPSSEEDRDDDEGPVHEVTIENAYHLGKYEVTQAQWVEIMGNNPLYFDGDNKPVEQISWNEVQEFIKKLNAKEGTDKYRLPSEAEWEYACRAGTASSYSFGDDESKLEDYAWYCFNSGNITHPVGQKKPNPWGLYDMHGNVWEWCQDRWHDTYKNAPTDGSAWEDGNSSYRVSCGGSFFDTASGSRSAVRFSYDPSRYSALLGFRLLREV
ncbi:formylglycine-generating enzyme family protein [uncultured Methanomethylovorans sp.]|uniref:formylglycine-generating enzyme family protein n=1 Tax=uncultured Methanomethylovorans sp. TaxID=183759 RepID=UPI002AA7411F|nr:formylglycine-generating enzyme family protein [uncultured Methanomethylovorans sp.]